MEKDIGNAILSTDTRFFPENMKYNTISEEYFCIDIETTGLEPEGEGIIEIFWKHVKEEVTLESKHRLFWHPNYEKTQHVHQIPYDEIKDKPMFDIKDFDSIESFNDISYFIDRCCDPNDNISLMAQYAPFEIKWLSDKMNINIQDIIKVYDTRSVEKFLHPEESSSLIPMCERRGIESPNGIDFHRASWDVEAMYKAAQSQLKELEEYGLQIGDKWRALE